MRVPLSSILCLGLISLGLIPGTAAFAQEHDSTPWEPAIVAFEEQDRAQPPEPGQILFLGSSSIRFWDLERWLPRHRTINRGFGGSQIADSLHFFDRLVLPHRPSHVVFYAGDNDIAAGKSPERVVADFEALLTRLADELPETRLSWLPIKPSLARWELWPSMREVNEAIARLAESNDHLDVIDVATPMLGGDGKPRPELFVDDGLHLNAAGYRLWSELVGERLPYLQTELIFPWDAQHNHGSSVVELPNGDLLTCWYRGSGERQADDVAVLGARKSALTGQWSEPFVLADTPDLPEANCSLFVDSRARLWLFYPTILDNRWESALMKLKSSSSWLGPGPPVWDRFDVLHVKPGDDFPKVVERLTAEYFESLGITPDQAPKSAQEWAQRNVEMAGDKLTRRLGWFNRAHPIELDAPAGEPGRILFGLYSDGFSFGSSVYSDDRGHTWTMGGPIVGGGAIQPSFAQRDDGTVVAYLRDNGPVPKRVHVAESKDGGESWTVTRDHDDLPDPGSGSEILELRSGLWILVHNDLEQGRHQLAVSISEDEGRTFPRRRYLEHEENGNGRFHYPSVIQARDGSIRVTYSVFMPDVLRDDEGAPAVGKSIRYAELNEAWLRAVNEL